MEEYVSFAETLADAAREVIKLYWRTKLVVEDKLEDERAIATSPVTIADRESERRMRELINARFPGHGIYGEEFGNENVDAEYVWVLDPIDGTKSFITGKPLFGTLIALLHHGKPVIGIIDQCILGERWVGAAGKPTLLNGKPVSASGAEELKQALMYSTTPYMFHEGFEECRFKSLVKQVKHTLYGCDCYAYAILASGFGADIIVEADLGLYDYCALVPVIKGAGGAITDWNGCELTLQGHSTSKGRVAASSNEKLHQQVLSYLRDDSDIDHVKVLEDEANRLLRVAAKLRN